MNPSMKQKQEGIQENVKVCDGITLICSRNHVLKSILT